MIFHENCVSQNRAKCICVYEYAVHMSRLFLLQIPPTRYGKYNDKIDGDLFMVNYWNSRQLHVWYAMVLCHFFIIWRFSASSSVLYIKMYGSMNLRLKKIVTRWFASGDYCMLLYGNDDSFEINLVASNVCRVCVQRIKTITQLHLNLNDKMG